METWHHGYRSTHPELTQLAVSRPPWPLRLLDRLGFIQLDPRVMSTQEVYDLAESFASSAAAAVDAGYHGIHIAGANMGIVEQFCSPLYNRRTDEFGADDEGPRPRFLEVLHDTIRDRVGEDVPIVTKIPIETVAPWPIRHRLDRADGVQLASVCESFGYDAVVPVIGTGFWDASIIRGAFPERAWHDQRFTDGYAEAFGGHVLRRLVAFGNRLQSRRFSFQPGWNADFCREVKHEVDIPVLAEGGIRSNRQIRELFSSGACDLVGMARPFYAEPRLPARLLAAADAAVVCDNCNNCTIPQVAGARGVCRTPYVLAQRAALEREGAYDR